MGLNVVRNGSLSFLWVNEKSRPLLELFGLSLSMNAILKVVRDVRESGEAQDETIHETSTGERDKVFNGNGNISNKLVTVVEALLQICKSLFTCKSVEKTSNKLTSLKNNWRHRDVWVGNWGVRRDNDAAVHVVSGNVFHRNNATSEFEQGLTEMLS